MRISFFEEFPTKKNLEKLKLVSWLCKLYVAAESIDKFNKIKSTIKNQQIKEFIYWPILAKKEGYWISPYSQRKALLRIFDELKDQKISVMLDLELPTTQNPWLYITQKFNFLRNKWLIKKFIKDYQGKLFSAEYFNHHPKWLQWLGLHYPSPKITNIKMLYHSLHDFDEDDLQGKKIVGFGTIAVGIHGQDPLLDAKVLEKDLMAAKKARVKEVVMFRLGGLNQKYVRILERFI